MKTIDLTSQMTLETITNQNEWVLVKYSASWCQPCKRLDPVFDSTLAQRADIQAVKVDVDLNMALAQASGVRAVPTLTLFKAGQVVSQVSGAKTEVQLQSWLDEHVQPVKTFKEIES